MAIALLVFGAILAAFGAGVSLYGWQRYSYYRLIAGTPTTDVMQVDEPGLVGLSGAVVSSDDPESDDAFEAPLSGTEGAVVAGWRVDEWSETGDYSRWKTLATGVDSVPFAIDDGTDQVVVDPGSRTERKGLFARIRDAAELRDSVEIDGVAVDFREFPTVREVGAREETPPEVRRFVDEQPSLTRQTDSITNVVDIGNAHGDRRYREATITVGDEVYLLGPIRAREGDRTTARLHPEQAVVEPVSNDEEPFVLSERSEGELLAATQSSRWALVFGAGIGLVGLAMAVAGIV